MAYFIVFEGLDGAGKSSLMKALAQELSARNLPVHLTREPGGTPLGDALRPLILDPKGPRPCPRAELLLYEASRAQHVEDVIKPKLAHKTWVLSDRYSASSLAFQAAGRELAVSHVEWLNEFATQGLAADLTVLLDLSVETARARRSSRSEGSGEGEDRIEAEKDEFHDKVRLGFLGLAKKDSNKWLVLSAELSLEELKDKLMNELRRRHWLD